MSEKKQPKKRLTKAAKLEAIVGTGGILKAIAAKTGVTRQTVAIWRDTDPDIAEAIESEKTATIDQAESNIVEAINAGDLKTSRWFLGTRGRHRGYSTRVEVEGNQPTGQVVIYHGEKAPEAKELPDMPAGGGVRICLPDNGRG